MTTHRVHKYSSIARPLEANYPTNRAVLFLAPLAGIAVAVADIVWFEAGPLPALLTAILGLLVAFLSWALARELAPDHERAAFLALVAAPFGLLLGPAAILSAAVALFLARIINRTVGPAATGADCVLTLILLALAMWRDGAWALGVAAMLAFALDATLFRPQPRRWLFVLASLVMTVAGFLLFGGADAVNIAAAPYEYLGLAVALTLGVLLIAMTQPAPVSVCDATGEPLNRARLSYSIVVVLVSAWALALAGQSGLVAGIPIWAALAAGVEGHIMPKRKV